MSIKQIIDLTHHIHEGMIKYDAHWHPEVMISQMGTIKQEGRETRKLVMGTHTGTHVDAPLHFVKNGKSIDKISLDRLIGNVTIIDCTQFQENEEITVDFLKKFELTKRLIFKFNWEKNWNTDKFYKNYPYFSVSAANFLVDNNVDLIAYDTPSPDDSRIQHGSTKDSQIHKIFLGNDIILVEYLANLSMVDNYEGWNIAVLPLKIKDADGAPARVFLFR